MLKRLSLLLLVSATAAVSIGGTLVLTNDRLERAKRLGEQAETEMQRTAQRLAAVSRQLETERHKSDRRLREDTELGCASEQPQATVGTPGEAIFKDRAAYVAGAERAARITPPPTGDPTLWDELRAGSRQSIRASDGADGPVSRAASVAELLDLDQGQQNHYEELLSDFEQRVDALYDRVALQYDYTGQDALEFQDMLQEIELEKAELDAALDQEFTYTLTDEQAARYLALPAEERGVGPNAGLGRLELRILDLPWILSPTNGMLTD